MSGWKWHYSKWHYFTYDPDANDGGSACGKYGYRLIGSGRTPSRPFRNPLPDGEPACESCKTLKKLAQSMQ